MITNNSDIMNRQSLNSADNEIVKLFDELGLCRTFSKTLMYISKVKHCRSVDIEKGANVSQCEVSRATRQLTKLGLIDMTLHYDGKKGRPITFFHLKKDTDSVIAYFQKQKQDEMKRNQQKIQKLKTLFSQQKNN